MAVSGETIPYTYIIKSRVTGDVYYGVKFAKGCNPETFWKDYFTSSSTIRYMVEWYGKESFDYQIRKTFSNKESALHWEHKVLRRMSAKYKPTWINKHDASNNFKFHQSTYTKERKQKIANKSTGRKHSEETKNKIREKSKLHRHSEETKLKISDKRKQLYASPDFVDKRKGVKTGIPTSKKQKESVSKANKKRYNEGKLLIEPMIEATKVKVSCEGVIYSSITEAQKAYPGTNIYKRLDNPKHPQFYRLRSKSIDS